MFNEEIIVLKSEQTKPKIFVESLELGSTEITINRNDLIAVSQHINT